MIFSCQNKPFPVDIAHTQDNAACFFFEKGAPIKRLLSCGEGVWVNPLKMENLQQKCFFQVLLNEVLY